MTPPDGALVGPYRLGRLLGRGGMAVVYEATQESVGREVALKLVSPDLADPHFLERFRREGRLQAALDHPNIVTVYEAGTSDHGPYLAMQLVRGTTLAALIDDGVLTSARTLDLLEQVAAALDAAHAAGLVHRDVKPRNVLVDGDHAYLADFGLTRSGTDGATASGHFVGTIAYVAPEVVLGGAAGPEADRYALAAVLFECLTGTTPFPRATHAAVLYAHTSEPPPRLSGRREGIPPGLDDVLITGLAKDPSLRPPSATDLIARARAALAGTELSPPAPRVHAEDDDDDTTMGQVTQPSVPVRRVPGRRGRAKVAVAAVAGALLGAGVLALLERGSDEPAAAAVAAPPPAPEGSIQMGATLAEDGRTVDCHNAVVTPASPTCSLFQVRGVGDAVLVVPRNGVIRRWGVRSAVGEFALSVIRNRDGYFQIARSRNEFADDPGPHVFRSDLAVERGDRLALVVIGGSGVGLRPSAGELGRFEPVLAGLSNPVEPGPPGELLLRADLVPGAVPFKPRQLTGADAAAAPDGITLASARTRYPNGVRVEVRLVTVDGRGALDLIRAGKRTVRIEIDDVHPPLDIDPTVAVGADPERREHLFIDLAFRRLGSARLIRHYLEANARRFFYFG